MPELLKTEDKILKIFQDLDSLKKIMASIDLEIFDIIGELILMKEESKEDEEHVRVSIYLHYSYSYEVCFFFYKCFFCSSKKTLFCEM